MKSIAIFIFVNFFTSCRCLSMQNGAITNKSLDIFYQNLEIALEKKFGNLKSEVLEAISQQKADDRADGRRNKTGFHNPSFGVGVDFYSDEPLNNTTDLPRNCYEIWEKGIRDSGVYSIKPDLSRKPFKVLCDMTIQGGGWTHIQRRVDGHIDFYRGWRDYNFGFGFLEDDGEFWMGLRNIYALTDIQTHQLLIEIIDRQGEKRYALYENFAIGREEEAYPLRALSGYKGDAGDSLTHHLGMKFSTYDFDQDNSTLNCAEVYQGAWWYRYCHLSNLNGKFVNVELPEAYKFKGLHWNTFHSLDYCHAQARMLVKPAVL